ncbi:hypothetical protein C8R46DRAFT_1169561 [Mycena filopes]|nr:hypothetical protein C8R46DRAFT_1169561 [Mycena filopes]
METHRGPGCGSYIWGRSIHNTRIEQLWYNVTHGFGQNINKDTLEWAEAWNSHKLQIKGERKCSPRDMFLFSMVQDGPHGISHMVEVVDEPVDDPSSYGVDWHVTEEPCLMCHLLQENPQEWENENPFHTLPTQLSDVPCEPPNCPFTPAQVEVLDWTLSEQVNLTSRDMLIHRMVWQEAFNICSFFQRQM